MDDLVSVGQKQNKTKLVTCLCELKETWILPRTFCLVLQIQMCCAARQSRESAAGAQHPDGKAGWIREVSQSGSESQ